MGFFSSNCIGSGHPLPTALVAAVLSIAVTTPAIANADLDVLFIGGTGTSATEPFADETIDSWVAPFIKEPHSTDQLLYNAALQDDPYAAVPSLTSFVAQAPDGTQITVVGLSKGAQVIHRALITYNTDPNAPDPSKVRFVLVGDPDGDQGFTRPLGFSAPHEIRYNVETINAQYDGFADFPDRIWNLVAVANAVAGILFVHTAYGQGGDLDPLLRLGEAQTTERDNLDADGQPNGTTSITRIVPTHYLPLTLPIRLFVPQLADLLDAILRPVVDAGYSRGPIVATSPTKPKPVVEQDVAPTPESRVTDLPDVNASLVSVPKVSTPDPEPVKVAEPVKDEPKSEPKDEPKSEPKDEPKDEPEKSTDGNKFSPGDTVADKIAAKDEPEAADTADGNKVTPATTAAQDEPKTGSDAPEATAPVATDPGVKV